MHKMAVFCNIKFQTFPGEHAPGPPSELLNFRTQVHSLCTQVQTGQGKTLLLYVMASKFRHLAGYKDGTGTFCC